MVLCYSHSTWVSAAVKGMFFKLSDQFILGWGIEIREFWSRIGYYLLANRSVVWRIYSITEIEIRESICDRVRIFDV